MVTKRDSLLAASLVTDGVNFAVLPDGCGFVTALGGDTRAITPYRLALQRGLRNGFPPEDYLAN